MVRIQWKNTVKCDARIQQITRAHLLHDPACAYAVVNQYCVRVIAPTV